MGIIRSVSTLARSMGATSPLCTVNALHCPASCHSRTSTKCPATAAAAAIAGLTRWVRPPKPWRPSKLRLEVEAQCSPAPNLSAFMARHMEQPGSRHSIPASRKILIKTLGFSLLLHFAGARHDQRLLDGARHLVALDHRRSGAQVLDTRVGAGANEHPVGSDIRNFCAGIKAHIFQCPGHRAVRVASSMSAGSGSCHPPAVPFPARYPRSLAAGCLHRCNVTTASKTASSS